MHKALVVIIVLILLLLPKNSPAIPNITTLKVSFMRIYQYNGEKLIKTSLIPIYNNDSIVKISADRNSTKVLAILDPNSPFRIYSVSKNTVFPSNFKISNKSALILGTRYVLINKVKNSSALYYVSLKPDKSLPFIQIIKFSNDFSKELNLFIKPYSKFKYIFNDTLPNSWKVLGLLIRVFTVSLKSPKLSLDQPFLLKQYKEKYNNGFFFLNCTLIAYTNHFAILNNNNVPISIIVKIIPIIYSNKVSWYNDKAFVNYIDSSSYLRVILPENLVIKDELKNFDIITGIKVPRIYSEKCDKQHVITFYSQESIIHFTSTNPYYFVSINANGKRITSSIKYPLVIKPSFSFYHIIDIYWHGILFLKFNLTSLPKEFTIHISDKKINVYLTDIKGNFIKNVLVKIYSIDLGEYVFSEVINSSPLTLSLPVFSKYILMIYKNGALIYKSSLNSLQDNTFVQCNLTSFKILLNLNGHYSPKLLSISLSNLKFNRTYYLSGREIIVDNLPLGTYNLTLINNLYNIKVYKKVINVNKDLSQLIVSPRLADLKVNVYDLLGHPVKGTDISLIVDKKFSIHTIAKNGNVTFECIPLDSYTLSVRYHNTEFQELLDLRLKKNISIKLPVIIILNHSLGLIHLCILSIMAFLTILVLAIKKRKEVIVIR